MNKEETNFIVTAQIKIENISMRCGCCEEIVHFIKIRAIKGKELKCPNCGKTIILGHEIKDVGEIMRSVIDE